MSGPDATRGQMTSGMKSDWEVRAQENAMHSIASDRVEWDESEFYREGPKIVETVVDPVLLALDVNPEGKRVLEIGCGVGRLFEGYSERFEEVWGIDISPTMIKLGQEKCPAEATWLVGDGATLAGGRITRSTTSCPMRCSSTSRRSRSLRRTSLRSTVCSSTAGLSRSSFAKRVTHCRKPQSACSLEGCACASVRCSRSGRSLPLVVMSTHGWAASSPHRRRPNLRGRSASRTSPSCLTRCTAITGTWATGSSVVGKRSTTMDDAT